MNGGGGQKRTGLESERGGVSKNTPGSRLKAKQNYVEKGLGEGEKVLCD